MEIIILPYLAISFSIGWAIFSPFFAKVDDFRQWSFAKIRTSDLFATFIPSSVLLSMALWVNYTTPVSGYYFAFLGVVIFLVTLFGLFSGLFLLAKLDANDSLKRIMVIGIIMPLGSLLTFAWIVGPMVAYAISILYAIPASLAVIPVTILLRGMSGWVCRESV